MPTRLRPHLRPRELLIIPGAFVVATLVVLASTAFGPSQDATDAVRAADVSTTAGPVRSTSTSPSTAPADMTTTAGPSPTTTVAASAPTTEAASRVPTTATTRAPDPAPVTTVTAATRPPCPRGSAPADVVATRFCEYRAEQGLPVVTRNAALDKAATDWAQTWAATDAVTGLLSISHNPDAGALVTAICCLFWGENVAFNSTSAVAAWTAWLASPHHLENIRTPQVGQYGVGTVTANGTTYFVHLFGWE